tara:strand:- start:13244 stop:13441 length:198 start_codon:yes stop_codon:yes gene_type:complete
MITDLLTLMIQIEVGIIVIGGFLLLIRRLKMHGTSSERRFEEPSLVGKLVATNSKYAQYDRLKND